MGYPDELADGINEAMGPYPKPRDKTFEYGTAGVSHHKHAAVSREADLCSLQTVPHECVSLYLINRRLFQPTAVWKRCST